MIKLSCSFFFSLQLHFITVSSQPSIIIHHSFITTIVIIFSSWYTNHSFSLSMAWHTARVLSHLVWLSFNQSTNQRYCTILHKFYKASTDCCIYSYRSLFMYLLYRCFIILLLLLLLLTSYSSHTDITAVITYTAALVVHILYCYFRFIADY